MNFSLARQAAPDSAASGRIFTVAPARSRAGGSTTAAWVAIASQAPARRPAPEIRQGVEHATGTNLGNARVRTGAGVDAAARAFGADAFTVGRDIHVSSRHHAPGTPAGDRLLAHELTHVAQQGAADPQIAAPDVRPEGDAAERVADAVAGGARLHHPIERVAPAMQRRVAQKHTTGITLDVAELQKWAAADYWTQKLLGVYAASMPLTRFAADAEERDAVLSAAWTEHLKLGTVSAAVVRVITLPKRAATTKELAYRLEFNPPSKGSGDSRPTLDIAFLAEGSSAVSATPQAPATAPSWPSSWRESGFPTGGLRGYAKAHAGEVDQLLGFVNATPAGKTFAQVVETHTVKPAHAATFVAEGSKDASGTLTALTVRLAAQRAPEAGTVPGDYATHDGANLEIEKLQGLATDRLGTINGLASIPADERLAVKFAVWQYFKAGRTRNAEVDAIVPLPDGTRRILYTLIFEPRTNDVSVSRIGEERKGAAVLDPAMHQFDVKRVQGFDPAFATDAARFKTWLGNRYPGIAPSGADAPAMVTDANTKLNAGAGTVPWFAQNYKMPVLDKTAGATRLQTAHHLDVAQTADMKNYEPAELRLVEWAIEMLSDALLGIVRGLSLVRQTVKIGKVERPPTTRGGKPTVTYPTEPSTAGESFTNGSERTISLYDSIMLNDRALFIGQSLPGGDSRVAPLSAMTVVHEFGHVVGWTASEAVRTAFNAKFVAARATLRTAPVTAYAAKSPNTEFFPEAFAIYTADPEWMQTNLPDMYAWFEALAKTGTAP